MNLTYGSICSGIEAASVAWEPLGWEPLWFSEIEPFPCAVLKHHWPHVPNLGDMTKLPTFIELGGAEAPDVLVGGTPCQAFSVAGLRAGLDDDRGQLTMKYVELADAADRVREEEGKPPVIVVWENVPGVLSDKQNAFGCFLAALSGEDEPLNPTGEKWANRGVVFGPKRAIAWRVLDAQYFGVAQRRRRVFLVASGRNDFHPAQVLFEFEGVRRDIAPSRQAGEKDTELSEGSLGYGLRGAGWWAEGLGPLRAQDKGGWENLTVEVCPTLRAGGNSTGGDRPPGTDVDTLESLVVQVGNRVRRLVPVECERLQGFPDNHTQVPTLKKLIADDGPRYKALGNSKAIPCVRWLGRRINQALLKPWMVGDL